MFSSEAWLSNSSNFYNSVATQSLRFDNASSSHLKGTLSSSFNTYTFSAWIKRSTITASYFQYIFSSGTGGLAIGSTSSHTDKFYVYDGTTAQPTDAVYRDASGWYHVVLSSNSGTGVLYVNGVSVKTGINCASTSTTTNYTMIGYYPVTASALYFDGYMAEVNFLDGIAIGDTDADGYLDEFGQIKNEVWIPKRYTGSYGTNGFRLQFNQTGTGTGSSSTIGADTSGNDNHFDSSGIVASDCNMPDSPENNFATLNPTDKDITAYVAPSEGNLKAVNTATSAWHFCRSTIGVNSGKWYVECRQTGKYHFVAVMLQDKILLQNSSLNANGVYGCFNDNGVIKDYSNGTIGSNLGTFADGDIIGLAYDYDAGTCQIYVNNTLEGTVSSIPTGTTVCFVSGFAEITASQIWNYGQDSSFVGNTTAQGNTDGNGIGDFYYSPPSGYLALCTANLPEPTISPNADTQADDYFNTVTFTGSGSTRSVTGVGFQPDWLWFKRRDSAVNHAWYDVIRGGTNALRCNTTAAESQFGDAVVTFETDGFEIAGTNVSGINGSSESIVSWNWKAGGTAVSNTDGSITSSVSANTDAGFSIVAYQGNDATSATVGHGLSQAPEMVIVKNRQESISNPSWPIYHASNTSAPETDYLDLNSTNATSDALSVWNDTAPTSTVVTIGTADSTNSGSNHIMYCFHSVEGYSKFGSFIGNGSTDGTFIYTGFRPAWLMLKRSEGGTSAWNVADAIRSPENEVDEQVQADGSASESTIFDFDFLSNGFKARTTDAARNGSGSTYIYMAFAENPFKYANAR